ncbi:MAG TPA: response regulator [Candidatus Saccharimonadales bacterium]|nr:response regulator [Candidatus Saccharimonadales bacterium]
MAQLLIIEPDRVLGGFLKKYFSKADYSVTVHTDPQAALTTADRRPPDALVAELQLGGRSGVEFLYEFRSYPDWQAAPIIIYTNLHPDQVAVYKDALKDLNVTACLYKSQAGLAELLQAIRQALPAHAEV